MDKQSKQLIAVVIGTLLIGALAVAIPFPRPSLHFMPSAGMEPTVPVNSRLWINCNAYHGSADVRRGDIVLFLHPKSSMKIRLRRIIGIPGDKVRLLGTSLWINGEKLNHTVVKTTSDGTIFSEGRYQVFYFSKPADPTAHDLTTVTVPADHFFVLGDHRDDALDSRTLGCIPFSSIQGRAMGK